MFTPKVLKSNDTVPWNTWLKSCVRPSENNTKHFHLPSSRTRHETAESEELTLAESIILSKLVSIGPTCSIDYYRIDADLIGTRNLDDP